MNIQLIKTSLLTWGTVNCFLALLFVVVVAMWGLTEKWPKPELIYDYRSSIPETFTKVYFDVGKGLIEQHAHAQIIQSFGKWKEVRLELPKAVIHGLRLDPAISPGTIGIRNLRIVDGTGRVHLEVPPSAIRSGNHVLSRVETNGTLEVQTTPGAYDPSLLIYLDEKIDLRLSENEDVTAKLKRMLARVLSVWWVIVFAGLLIFDLYYRPLCQRKVPFLYRLALGDHLQKPKPTSIKKYPMDFLAGTVILLFLVYAAVFTPYVQDEPHLRSDGVGSHIWTHGIKSGDYSFCRYEKILSPFREISRTRAIPFPHPDYPTGEIKIRCLVRHPPGIALIRLPLMIWFVDPSNKYNFSNAEHQISQMSAIIALILIIIVVSKILRHHHIGSENIQLAIITVVFGAGLYHYSTYDNSLSHIYTALGVALFSLATFLNSDRNDSLRYLFLLTVLSLWLVLVRNTNVFIVLFFWMMWLHESGFKKIVIRVLVSGLGVFGAAVIQLVYNYSVTWEFILSSYAGSDGFNWSRPMLWSALFSYDKGLFIYYPIFAATLLAGFICKKTRMLTLFYLGLILFYALFYGFYSYWYLGGTFGFRIFVDFSPLLIIILAIALHELRFWTALIFQGFSVLSVLITVQFMSAYWQQTLPHDLVKLSMAQNEKADLLLSLLLGREGTPFYWHGVLILVCAFIVFRTFKKQKH